MYAKVRIFFYYQNFSGKNSIFLSVTWQLSMCLQVIWRWRMDTKRHLP